MSENLLNLLRQAGITPKKHGHNAKRGAEFCSPCPLCGGEDRFVTWPEAPTSGGGQGFFWCRGCDFSGDVIEFLRRVGGLTFKQAAARAGKRLPLRPPTLRLPGSPAPNTAKGPAKIAADGISSPSRPQGPELPGVLWREKLGHFVARCRERLAENKAALDELAARGIDPAAAARWRLGWNPGDRQGRDLYRDRAAWGAPPATRPDGRAKRLWLPVGLVIPAYSPAGDLLRVKIRRPRPQSGQLSGPRYYVVPGSSRELVLLDSGRPVVVVVEAELDALAVAALTPAAALALGSAQVKPSGAALAHLERARQILVALDADAPGAQACAWWLERFPRARRWPVPQGKDPGEAYAAGVDLNAWVRAGLNPRLKLELGGTLPGAAREISQVSPASGAPKSEPLSERSEFGEPGRSERGENRESERRSGKGAPAPAEIPPSVLELAELLADAPVVFEWSRTSGRQRLVCRSKAFDRAHPGRVRRISELFFFDPAVENYLIDHPAEEISAANLLYRGRVPGQGANPQPERG